MQTKTGLFNSKGVREKVLEKITLRHMKESKMIKQTVRYDTFKYVKLMKSFSSTSMLMFVLIGREKNIDVFT